MQFGANINLYNSHSTDFYTRSHFLILRFEMFNLENLYQGHGEQHSQRPNSMANVNVYKSREWACSVAHTVFQILLFQILWPWKRRSRSQYSVFAMSPCDSKHMTSYLMAIVMFAPPHHLRDIRKNIENIECKKFNLQNKCQGQGGEKRHLRNRMKMFDCR